MLYAVVLPNTPAAEGLSPAGLEKRSNSFNARRTLLKSNPSLYVSKTRLSIRQIPLFVSEAMLRRMALHAVRAFEEDVKAGRRSPLTADELAASADQKDEGESPTKSRKELRKGKVKQVKIVRQQDRVDMKTGTGKSKGYGFLEMRTHADSLRVLRWSNNNPEVSTMWDTWKKEVAVAAKHQKEKGAEGGDKDDNGDKAVPTEGEPGAGKTKGSLIVEFSIENVQVVQRRAAKERAARTKVGLYPHFPAIPDS